MIGKREVRLVAVGSVFISIFHDWGFFFVLGASFAQAPTTIADHLQSWLVWLPGAAIAALLFPIVDFPMRRASSDNPAAKRKFRNGASVLSSECHFRTSCWLQLWLSFGLILPSGSSDTQP